MWGMNAAAEVEGRVDPVLDIRHNTFAITRGFAAPPASVFAAFQNDELRRRWYRLPGSRASYEHEFGVGGGEDAHSTHVRPDGTTERLAYNSRYLDIVADRRIVFAYRSIIDDLPRWASLVTVVIADAERYGSVLTWTEHVAFMSHTGDGSADFPHLRGAATLRLNGLAAALP